MRVRRASAALVGPPAVGGGRRRGPQIAGNSQGACNTKSGRETGGWPSQPLGYGNSLQARDNPQPSTPRGEGSETRWGTEAIYSMVLYVALKI